MAKMGLLDGMLDSGGQGGLALLNIGANLMNAGQQGQGIGSGVAASLPATMKLLEGQKEQQALNAAITSGDRAALTQAMLGSNNPTLQTLAIKSMFEKEKPEYKTVGGTLGKINDKGEFEKIYTDTQTANKAPSGYQWNESGELAAIPGGPADPKNKPLTEGQSNAAIFAQRLKESDPIIQKYSGANTMGQKIMGDLPYVGNFLVSDDYQKLDQAKRDFVNAVLRKESGAAISPSEFENADKQYFPQPGDSESTIQQKAANRSTVIRMMGNAAGPSSGATLQPAKSSQAAPKFLGFE